MASHLPVTCGEPCEEAARVIIQVLAYEFLGTLQISVSVAGGPHASDAEMRFWRKAEVPAMPGAEVRDLVALVGEETLNLAYYD